MSVKTLRVSRQGGAAFNTMKNTQIRCGAGWTRTSISRPRRAFCPLNYYPKNRQFLWPTTSLKDCGSYPHRLSGVSIAGPYEQISIVYVVWQIPLSFSFLLVTGFSGPVTIVPARFPVPGHTTRIGDAGFVAGLSPSTILLPTCQGTLLFVPQGGLALSILPGHGRHCSYATAVALIARGHEVDQTSECA